VLREGLWTAAVAGSRPPEVCGCAGRWLWDAGFVSMLCGEGKWSGGAVQESRFQKRKMFALVGDGDGAGEGEGEGKGFGLGFLAGRGFGVSGPVGGKTWRRGVCGAGRVIWGCVCGQKARRGVCVCAGRRRAEGLRALWRNGEAVERWSGAVEQ